jgi:hypothetical protein
MAKKPSVIKYQGGTYKLTKKADGLGTTSRRFPLITKEYVDDVRSLAYDGGAYILELALKWKFNPGAQADLPPVPLEERDAAMVFHALLRDGGNLSDDYKEQERAGTLPEPIKKITGPLQAQKELSAPAMEMAAGMKNTAGLLRWRGEDMLLVPPDEDVSTIRFHLCSPEQGFSLGGLDYPGVPRDLLESFSHELHIELTQMFPGASIDTQIVNKPDAHCGYPVVLNRGGGQVKGHNRKIETMAHDIWKQFWMAFQRQ